VAMVNGVKSAAHNPNARATRVGHKNLVLACVGRARSSLLTVTVCHIAVTKHHHTQESKDAKSDQTEKDGGENQFVDYFTRSDDDLDHLRHLS